MERDEMTDTVMTYSPIERRIDMYGCEIGVSRQWYDETTAILMDINNGVYRKIPDGYDIVKREIKEVAEAIAEKCTYEPNKYVNKEDMLMVQTFCGLPIAEAVRIVEKFKYISDGAVVLTKEEFIKAVEEGYIYDTTKGNKINIIEMARKEARMDICRIQLGFDEEIDWDDTWGLSACHNDHFISF